MLVFSFKYTITNILYYFTVSNWVLLFCHYHFTTVLYLISKLKHIKLDGLVKHIAFHGTKRGHYGM